MCVTKKAFAKGADAGMVQLGFDAGSRVRIAVAATLVGCGVTVAACVSPTDIPGDAVQFTPPAVYQRWWAMTQSCAGRVSNFAAVRWFHVPGSHFMSHGRDVRGYYEPRENSVILSDSLAAFGAGVRHEMLHAVLGVPGHPREMFQGFCANVVTCPLACATDGGPWNAPLPWAPVKAESLVVTATAELMPPELDGDRWLTIRARVKNPQWRSVVAMMPQSQTFSFVLARPVTAGGAGVQDALWASDSSNYYFASTETKEFLFELRVGDVFNRYTVPPGDYEFAAGFGPFTSARGTINVMRLQAAGIVAASHQR